MNPFDEGIRAARRRQIRAFAVGLLGGVTLVALIAGIFLATTGINVIVAPDDAVPTARTEVETGLAVAIDNVVYGLPGSYSLRVGAEGFYDQVIAVTPERRSGNLLVTLLEKPGRLAFTTEPPREETRWQIDGSVETVGAQLETELAPGGHLLAIDNPYFEIVEETLSIERDTDYERVFPLTPVAGELRIATIPPGATVRIDGAAVAESPASIALEGGEYRVEIEEPDYSSVSETIVITRQAARVDRNYRLERIPGFLTVTVEPAGGQLLLNGRLVTPGERLTLASNEPQSLDYFKAGYRSVTREILLAPEEERTIDIRLQADVGKVRVESRPESTVLVNGKTVGTTPLELTLIAVDHRIELTKPGFRTVRKTVRPSADSPKLISETLLPELQARLKEAPARYTNSGGIELKLFRPGPFRMGAPRHEKGQRANEFEKDVNLTKAFYAALYEVTVDQFRRFDSSAAGLGDNPVTDVTWLQAAAYCNWLSKKESLTPFYQIAGGRLVGVNPTADGYRLLSEAEWEWLARKAGKPRQTLFYWGDDTTVPEKAGNIADEFSRGAVNVYVPNYSDGYPGIAPVGSFPPEASGLHDLAGNVSEWVHDAYSLVPPRKGKVQVDPLGAASGEVRVVKGANWRSGTRTALRPAFRDGLVGARDDTGFRIGRYLYGKENKQAAN